MVNFKETAYEWYLREINTALGEFFPYLYRTFGPDEELPFFSGNYEELQRIKEFEERRGGNGDAQLAWVENNENFRTCIENTINPLGDNITQLVMLTRTDLHRVPSITTQNAMAKMGEWILLNGFKREVSEYWNYVRGEDGRINLSSIMLGLGEVSKMNTHFFEKYMKHHASERASNNWVKKHASLIVGEDTGSTRAVFSLGDGVSHGCTLVDVVDAIDDEFDLVEKISTDGSPARLMLLNGNHEQFGQNPQAIEVITRLVGHNVFTQEVGGKLIVGLDTNILNPVWVEGYFIKASNDQIDVLLRRWEMQKSVVRRMLLYRGEVVVFCHEPGRVLKTFGSDLRSSGVIAVVGGHTHHEFSAETRFRNRFNGKVDLYVLDSMTHWKGGRPQSQKVYRITIGDEHFSIQSFKQPQAEHERDVEAMLLH